MHSLMLHTNWISASPIWLNIASGNKKSAESGQVDGVAVGSLLGHLVANAFLCSTEEQLERENKLQYVYHHFIGDMSMTQSLMLESVTTFYATLNECHPSIHFRMEIADCNKLPFLGMMIEKKGCELVSTMVFFDIFRATRICASRNRWLEPCYTGPTAFHLPGNRLEESATTLKVCSLCWNTWIV